jgi:hypothetical protein
MNLLALLGILTILISLVLSGLMLYHYSKKRHITSLIWTVAWTVVAVRVSIGIYLPLSIPTDILHNALNALHDFLWLIGIAIILELERFKSIVLPAICYSLYVLASGALSIKAGFFYSNMLMLGESTVMFFILAWFFKRYHDKFKRKGARLLWIGYFTWGLDNLILGPPYYALGLEWVGVFGFLIGFLCRLLLFIGFFQLMFQPIKPHRERA